MRSAAIYVAYGVDRLDLSWIDPAADVIVVHNDERLTETACDHPHVSHVHPGSNIGFGAAVNLAMHDLDSDRVVLCNPDTVLTQHHWRVLTAADENEVVTLALREADGTPNSVVNGYWNIPAFLATVWRLGRLVPRRGRFRMLISRRLGSWGRAHAHSLRPVGGQWPLAERWASGAVLSIPVAAMRLVGGFDEDYFLYYEDADLQQRMAAADDSLTVRVAPGAPGMHIVGGTAGSVDGRWLKGVRHRSAAVYATRQPGLAWRFVSAAIGGPRR